jgi:enamine deaminase RidA (YjgF/YER057c/UK114 family)
VRQRSIGLPTTLVRGENRYERLGAAVLDITLWTTFFGMSIRRDYETRTGDSPQVSSADGGDSGRSGAAGNGSAQLPDESTEAKQNATIRRINPPTLSKLTGYTHVAIATGSRTIYIAGLTATDKVGNVVGTGDLRSAQAKQSFRNLVMPKPIMTRNKQKTSTKRCFVIS